MYNKLFSKILDSSIWLEPNATRLVWLTFIAAMDEDGFAQFASVANVAHRARVTDEEAEEAIKSLEGPDINSSDKDNEGRRIERVPGGWMVLNAVKYRNIVSREIIRAQTRQRVTAFRERKRKCNGSVTPSESEAEAETETKTDVSPPLTPQGEVMGKRKTKEVTIPEPLKTEQFTNAWNQWLTYRKQARKPSTPISMQRQLEMLAQYGVDGAIKIINESITQGWTGLFPLKPYNKTIAPAESKLVGEANNSF